MFFTHDIFSPPDMGGPLGELGNGDLQPWQPQVVPEVAPGGELFAPRAIAEVNPLMQPFAPKPLPITGTLNVVPRTTASTARVPIQVPLLTVPKGGTQRPLTFLPGGSAPSADGGIMIPVPGQAPAPGPAAPSTTPAWVMPVAIGAGALLLGYLIFGRKKTATPNSRGWSRTEREAKGRRKKARRRHGRRRASAKRSGRPAQAFVVSGSSRIGPMPLAQARSIAAGYGSGAEVVSANGNWRSHVKRRRSKTGARVARAHWMAPNPKRRKKGKPRIVSGHPSARRCPHCGGAHSRSAHWSHMRGHHRSGPKGGSFYGHVR